MHPYVTIFGHIIGSYAIMSFIAIVISALMAVFYFSKFYNINKEDVFYAFLFALIGCFLGAKLLYIFINLPILIQYILAGKFSDIYLSLIRGGLVFYGGLFGTIFGLWIYAKTFNISFKTLFFIAVPVIPLFHSIARIGCFLAGCCYGIEYHGFGSVIFQKTPYARIGIPLFPTQLIESACNMIIFLILFITYKKFKGTFKTCALYCILYSITRFTLEFFRGDVERGIIIGLSTSQWISIILFIIGIILIIKEKKTVTDK